MFSQLIKLLQLLFKKTENNRFTKQSLTPFFSIHLDAHHSLKQLEYKNKSDFLVSGIHFTYFDKILCFRDNFYKNYTNHLKAHAIFQNILNNAYRFIKSRDFLSKKKFIYIDDSLFVSRYTMIKFPSENIVNDFWIPSSILFIKIRKNIHINISSKFFIFVILDDKKVIYNFI